jgi:hypothetical protein
MLKRQSLSISLPKIIFRKLFSLTFPTTCFLAKTQGKTSPLLVTAALPNQQLFHQRFLS